MIIGQQSLRQKVGWIPSVLLIQNNEITVGIRIMLLFVHIIFFLGKYMNTLDSVVREMSILTTIKYSFNQFATQTIQVNLPVKLDI